MMAAVNTQYQDVRTQLPVTMTRMPLTTTAAVPNSTSVAYAAVTALQKALATVKATC